jgi:spoIIIJ-associated protein
VQNLKIIKKTIEEFFEKSTFEVIVETLLEKDQAIFVHLKTKEPQILIGEGGQSLNEIQYLLKKILKRKIKDFFYFDLDINNYKKRKNEYLKEMIYSEADEVAFFKKEKELAPMSAYERRIIHLILIERKDVVSESVGQGEERRIKIKPSSF